MKGIDLNREDQSRFIIHFTRNDIDTFGDTGSRSEDNFKSIFLERVIYAFRPHCLFLKDLSEETEKLFHVACFTETPINQVDKLITSKQGRQINYLNMDLFFVKIPYMPKSMIDII
ncbi:MAG: hypothetical protein KDK90_28305 [Leptospiraceae bacterium]|nr:hypothetical protein [Leptospiraceae bacterium]